MADSIDRAINFILNLKSDQYESSLATVNRSTDAAMGAVAQSLGAVQGSMDAVTASTKVTSASMDELGKTAAVASGGMQAAAQSTATINTSMTALDTSTKAATTNLSSVGTAATATAKASEESSKAMKSASDSASALGKASESAAKATTESATAIGKASTAMNQAGQGASNTSKFFSDLGTRVTSLIPGLGGLLTTAAGVATGFGGLQIAEKVSGWFLDVGTKAIAGSAALKTINETVSKAQAAFQEAAGKGIETLANAITQLFGPAIIQFAGWVTDALKWVTAFGNWFEKSGIVAQLGQSFLDRLGESFGHVGTQANSTLATILSGLGILSTKVDENGQTVINWSGVWAKALKGIENQVVMTIATIWYASDQAQAAINAANKAAGDAGQAVHDAMVKAWDKMPDALKSWVTVLQVMAGATTAGLKDLNKQLEATPSAKANTTWQDYVAKVRAGLDSAFQGISKEHDALLKNTDAINGQAAAVDNLAKVGRAGFGQALKDWQAFLDLQKKINDAVTAFIGTYQDADKVMVQWGKDATQSADDIAKAMGMVTVVTDQQVNDQVHAIAVGYERQMELSKDSAEEQLRITQAYYDQLKKLLNDYGASVDDEHKKEVQSTIQTMDATAKAQSHSLDGIVQSHKDATKQTSELWSAVGKDMDKFMRQAASSMADTLWAGDKSFGKTMMSLLEDLGKSFTKTFIDIGLQAVKKFATEGLSGLSGFFGNVSQGLGGLFGGGGSGAMAGPGFAAPGGGGATSAIGGIASSTIGSAVSLVSGAVSAISGVISNFQLKGLTKVDENIQQGVFLTYYATANLYTEFVSYFHSFMNNWRNIAIGYYNASLNALQGLVARWDQAGINQILGYMAGIVSRIDRDIMPALRSMAGGIGGGAAPVINFDSASVVQAIQAAFSNIQTALGNLSGLGGNFSFDLTPLVTVSTQIRDALSQGALRPNVTLTVSTGVTPEQVSREIVYQLQMAGVLR